MNISYNKKDQYSFYAIRLIVWSHVMFVIRLSFVRSRNHLMSSKLKIGTFFFHVIWLFSRFVKGFRASWSQKSIWSSQRRPKTFGSSGDHLSHDYSLTDSFPHYFRCEYRDNITDARSSRIFWSNHVNGSHKVSVIALHQYNSRDIPIRGRNG